MTILSDCFCFFSENEKQSSIEPEEVGEGFRDLKTEE